MTSLKYECYLDSRLYLSSLQVDHFSYDFYNFKDLLINLNLHQNCLLSNLSYNCKPFIDEEGLVSYWEEIWNLLMFDAF